MIFPVHIPKLTTCRKITQAVSKLSLSILSNNASQTCTFKQAKVAAAMTTFNVHEMPASLQTVQDNSVSRAIKIPVSYTAAAFGAAFLTEKVKTVRRCGSHDCCVVLPNTVAWLESRNVKTFNYVHDK